MQNNESIKFKSIKKDFNYSHYVSNHNSKLMDSSDDSILLPEIFIISPEISGLTTQKIQENDADSIIKESLLNMQENNQFTENNRGMILKPLDDLKISLEKNRSLSLCNIDNISPDPIVNKSIIRRNKVLSLAQDTEIHDASIIVNPIALNKISKSYGLTGIDKIKSDSHCRAFSWGSLYYTNSNSAKKGLSRQNSIKNLARSDERVFSISELEIQELLGEGFFGRVYKVMRKSNKEIMVMKELKQVNIDAEKQFIREIGLLKVLNHKNVLKYLGVVFVNRQFNVILEFIPGGTLRKLIKGKSVCLTPMIKSKLAMDIASGMAYLHSMKIAHRDLTSKNVLVHDYINFDAVVSDFGLSRVIRRLSSLFVPDTPEKLDVVGTPFWMAPEMLKGNDYDLSVDNFSYGIVLCEILGCTSAHPDDIPRLNNFGLNDKLFREKISHIDNPIFLINIAVKSCDMNPEKRPSFMSIFKLIQRRKNDLDTKRKGRLLPSWFG